MMCDYISPPDDDPNWLEREINAAIKEVNSWPKWMQDAARFEPFGKHDYD